MKRNELIIIGSIVSSFGIFALSCEIIIVQFLRFYMWTNGIVYWGTTMVSDNESRATSASSIISTTWINIAFIITVIVVLLGIIMLLICLAGKLSKYANKSN